MAEISVTGRATRTVAADEATLNVSFGTHGADRSAVIAEAFERHRALVQRATDLQREGRIERYVAREPHSWENWGQVGADRTSEYFANVQVSFIVTHLDEVDELVTDTLASGNGVDVSWALSDERATSVTRELRAEAVHDAQRAAEDYAAAIVRPVLTLQSLRDTLPGPRGEVMMARAGAAQPLEVTVQEIEVSVSVDATFIAATS